MSYFPKEYPKEGCTSWKKLVSKHLEAAKVARIFYIAVPTRAEGLKSVIEKSFIEE